MYFRPFQLACENMNPKIKATALDCIQKLIGPCPCRLACLPLYSPPFPSVRLPSRQRTGPPEWQETLFD